MVTAYIFFTVFGMLVGAFAVILGGINGRFKLRQELNTMTRNWQAEKQHRQIANKHIAKLAREAEDNRIDAERYSVVLKRLEQDDGGLSIDAFYGPHTISTAQELSVAIDEELDHEFHMSLYDDFGFKRPDLNG